ncbi:MAG: hypothetical protein ACYS7Y_30080 [Planctomycetota bacterium]|jgi:hypothetical protein
MSDLTFEEEKAELEERIRVAIERIEVVKRPNREKNELRKLKQDAEHLEGIADKLEERNG